MELRSVRPRVNMEVPGLGSLSRIWNHTAQTPIRNAAQVYNRGNEGNRSCAGLFRRELICTATFAIHWSRRGWSSTRTPTWHKPSNTHQNLQDLIVVVVGVVEGGWVMGWGWWQWGVGVLRRWLVVSALVARTCLLDCGRCQWGFGPGGRSNQACSSWRPYLTHGGHSTHSIQNKYALLPKTIKRMEWAAHKKAVKAPKGWNISRVKNWTNSIQPWNLHQIK